MKRLRLKEIATTATVAAAFLINVTVSFAAEPVLDHGAVASPDRYGAEAAREILAKGGNAVDAAVATAFALSVTYPEAGNLGGGGFMTVWFEGKPYFLDYRETAPKAAGANMYLDAKGDVRAGVSELTPLAAGVPGTVMGLWEAHRRFGKLPWKTDIAPAQRFARDGFSIEAHYEATVREGEAAFPATANFSRYFGGDLARAGSTFRQPELAASLDRIAEQGPKGFYEGKTAKLIVDQMGRGPEKGMITLEDLSGYRAKWRDALIGQWGDFTVVTAPPPSSGGIALLQLLNMKRDRKDLFDGVGLNAPRYVHLISEIEKRVFADRAEYLGDPDFVKVPVTALLDPAYVARRASEIDPAKPSATPAVAPGLEKPQTTHFSIVDRWGNAVSNTYTLNGSYGSGIVVEGAGFLLNNEMDDFSAKPGVPNMFGVVGADANAIQAGKRPLSSMTPTILLKDGKPVMVIGTPGGSRIFTSVFQVLVNVYDFGLALPEAQKAPRFHHQLLPENTIIMEAYAPSFSQEVTEALVKLGYRFENQGWNGDIEAIRIDGRNVEPVPDPRGRGVGMITE